jgi:hypothetical protein
MIEPDGFFMAVVHQAVQVTIESPGGEAFRRFLPAQLFGDGLLDLAAVPFDIIEKTNLFYARGAQFRVPHIQTGISGRKPFVTELP